MDAMKVKKESLKALLVGEKNSPHSGARRGGASIGGQTRGSHPSERWPFRSGSSSNQQWFDRKDGGHSETITIEEKVRTQTETTLLKSLNTRRAPNRPLKVLPNSLEKAYTGSRNHICSRRLQNPISLSTDARKGSKTDNNEFNSKRISSTRNKRTFEQRAITEL